MSSPPQPSLPGDAGPAAAAAAAAATASPGPASPRVPLAESSSPSTPGAAGGEQDEENEELPMTMAASVLLTSLPKDAKSALEGAGMEVFRRGKEGEFEKVKIHFRAVGSAPALKQPVRKLSPGLKFEKVVVFLRKQLRLKDHESVFCYVNSVFAPGLDEGIGNLWRCFKVKDELVVAYSITPAFG